MPRHSEYKRCNKPSIEHVTDNQVEYAGYCIVHDCALFTMHDTRHAQRRVTLRMNDVGRRLLSAIPTINSFFFPSI